MTEQSLQKSWLFLVGNPSTEKVDWQPYRYIDLILDYFCDGILQKLNNILINVFALFDFIDKIKVQASSGDSRWVEYKMGIFYHMVQ